MEFHDTIEREVATAVQDVVRRLRDAADAELREVRRHLEADLETIRRQADGLREELETESARAAALEADLDAVIEAHRQLEAERRTADAARAEEAAVRAAADDRCRLLEETIRTLEASLDAAERTLQDTRAALDAQTQQAQAEIDAYEQAALELRTQLADAVSALSRAREEADSASSRLADALARATAAETAASLAQEELAAARSGTDDGADTLHEAVQSLDAMANATTVDALLAALVACLAPRFDRIAVFRVKGHHLEGDSGAGLDPSTDITKLSVPLGLDSLLTRAAAARRTQALDADGLAREPSLLGGSPRAALAAPILFQGETFAVLYGDVAGPMDGRRRALAALLAGQAGILLSRLTQELKTLRELRDYAALLVQEAEQMFLADVEAGHPVPDRQRRLAETIDCARQLFGQRAALEGSAACRVLDDYLAERIAGAPDSPFMADLALVLATGAAEAAARSASALA